MSISITLDCPWRVLYCVSVSVQPRIQWSQSTWLDNGWFLLLILFVVRVSKPCYHWQLIRMTWIGWKKGHEPYGHLLENNLPTQNESTEKATWPEVAPIWIYLPAHARGGKKNPFISPLFCNNTIKFLMHLHLVLEPCSQWLLYSDNPTKIYPDKPIVVDFSLETISTSIWSPCWNWRVIFLKILIHFVIDINGFYKSDIISINNWEW